MLEFFKRLIPKKIRDTFRPYYIFLFKGYRKRQKVAGRNWNLEINIPEKENQDFINAILSGSSDFKKKNNNVNIVLCAQPKSASLYIVQLLASSLNLKNHQIGFDKKSGKVYYPRILASKYLESSSISHCHASATPEIIKMFKSLDIVPVILSRNLLDSLVSRRDMLFKDKKAGVMLSAGAMERFLKSSSKEQMDITIDLFANEYINFFAGWQEMKNSDLNPVFITYQEMIEDEIELVKKVALATNNNVDENKIKQVVNEIKAAGGINFNKGKTGRGLEAINEEQIEVLRQKAISLGCTNSNFLGFKL